MKATKILLASLLAASLSACSSGSPNMADEKDKEVVETKEETTVQIGNKTADTKGYKINNETGSDITGLYLAKTDETSEMNLATDPITVKEDVVWNVNPAEGPYNITIKVNDNEYTFENIDFNDVVTDQGLTFKKNGDVVELSYLSIEKDEEVTVAPMAEDLEMSAEELTPAEEEVYEEDYYEPEYVDDSYDAGYDNGYTDPGYTDPGYTNPGYTDPGYTDPGYTAPDYTLPDQSQDGCLGDGALIN